MIKYRGHVVFDGNIHFTNISEFITDPLLNVSLYVYKRTDSATELNGL
jgi:hypothetical protein